ALAQKIAPSTMLGIAAGIGFGLSAALIKATVALGTSAFASWQPYAMAAVTFGAFATMQRAFAAGPLVGSWAALNVFDPLTSVLLGLILYGERITEDPVHVTATLAAAILMLAGILALARSRFVSPTNA